MYSTKLLLYEYNYYSYVLALFTIAVGCLCGFDVCNMFACFQRMSAEFRRWMVFYGKEYNPYELERGDFLCDEMKDRINSATSVELHICLSVWIVYVTLK